MTREEINSLSREDLNILLRNGNDVPRGWIFGKNQPLWHRKVYEMWRAMWKRVVLSEYYSECTISDRWKSLSNYVYDFQNQSRFKEFCDNLDSRWDMDKDIKYHGNKHYSFNTCTLVLHSENMKEMHNRLGCPGSRPDAIKKRSQSKRRPVIAFDFNGNPKYVFDGINDVSKFGFKSSAVRSVAKGTRNHHKNLKWLYLTIIEL